ncbi:hypothetical protein [Desulfobulbus sp.]|uniref:hypothetical protein n=1 Tax=Desulfobulbus sp. TaxID=895 RepID=UPI00286F55DA|nr:hypothetical protein [Desulfobulbus sp.]
MNDQTYQLYRAALLALRRQVRVAHHLPGRIRLELHPEDAASMAALLKNGTEGLAAARALLPGIRALKFNALAGSAVLEYDYNLYPPQLVDAFFRATGAEQAGDLLDRLASQ